MLHFYFTYTSFVLHLYFTCTSLVLYLTCTSLVLHLYFTCTSLILHFYFTYTSLILHLCFTYASLVLYVYATYSLIKNIFSKFTFWVSMQTTQIGFQVKHDGWFWQRFRKCFGTRVDKRDWQRMLTTGFDKLFDTCFRKMVWHVFRCKRDHYKSIVEYKWS